MDVGDVLLIPFPFTDLSGTKTRPVVVLGKVKDDIIVAFISSETANPLPSDILLIADNENGLKRDSLLKVHKLATLHKKLALGLLGSLNITRQSQIKDALSELLNLQNNKE